MFDSILAIFKASLKDPNVGPSRNGRRRSSVRPMNLKKGQRCFDCQTVQMENQKLRSKVAQLEIQIAEMKQSQMKAIPYSGKCTFELGAVPAGFSLHKNASNGQSTVGARQIGHSSSMRISSASMKSKTKLSKVESSPLPVRSSIQFSEADNRIRKRATSSSDKEPQTEMRITDKNHQVRREEPPVRRELSVRQSKGQIGSIGGPRDLNPNGIMTFDYDAPKESSMSSTIRQNSFQRQLGRSNSKVTGKRTSPPSGQTGSSGSSKSPSPTAITRSSRFSKRRSSSVDHLPAISRITPFAKGSTITRSIVSKNGSERREAFRKSKTAEKSSIEKLHGLTVNRESKGPTAARLAMRRSSSATDVQSSGRHSLIQQKQNSVTVGPFQLLK